MTLQISDYLDSYLQLCDERNVFTVPSLRRSLQNAVDGGGQVPDAFHLSGTQSELSLTRLNDAYVDILLKPLVACGVVLRELDLSCNEIADAGAMQIAAFLKDDVVLETLNLRSNTIQPPGIIALARSLHINEHLRILNLGGNTIGSSGGLELANMLQLNSTLTTLLLDSANLPTPGLIALSTVLCNNTTLTTLDISNNYSTPFSRVATADFAAHFTKMLECNFNLVDIAARKLRMDDVDAKDRWARAIALNLRITHLDLTANNITRDGGVAILRSCHLHPSLLSLKLSHCSIQDEGAEAVAQMLYNNFALQTLHIDHNAITGAGLTLIAHALLQNHSLKRLRLWGNTFSTAACELWASLTGGPSVNVTTADTLRARHVRPGALFPPDGRSRVSAKAKSNDHPNHRSNSNSNSNEEDLAPPPSLITPRFREGDVDVVFYAVEGVVCVAHRPIVV